LLQDLIPLIDRPEKMNINKGYNERKNVC